MINTPEKCFLINKALVEHGTFQTDDFHVSIDKEKKSFILDHYHCYNSLEEMLQDIDNDDFTNAYYICDICNSEVDTLEGDYTELDDGYRHDECQTKVQNHEA